MPPSRRPRKPAGASNGVPKCYAFHVRIIIASIRSNVETSDANAPRGVGPDGLDSCLGL